MRRSTSALALLCVTVVAVCYLLFGEADPRAPINSPGGASGSRVIDVTRIAVAGDRVIHEPETFENLSVFMISGKEKISGANYSTLAEALEDGSVIVHETSNVNQLAVENKTKDRTVVILAGSIVKGGRQDRVLSMDMILKPNSGKVPIDAFCVEQSRWAQRGNERSDRFSSSKTQVSGKGLRKAVKNSSGQGKVWEEVANEQSKISSNIKSDVTANASPTSFQLAVENKDLKSEIAKYKKALGDAIDKYPEAIGYAACINGEFSTADVYANRQLFEKTWDQHISSAITEAISLKDQAKNEQEMDLSWREEIFDEQTYEDRVSKQAGASAYVADQNKGYFRYNSVLPAEQSAEADEAVIPLRTSYEKRDAGESLPMRK